MNLRKKTILAIAITFLLTIAVGYGYTHTLFLKSFLNIENQEIEANVRRLHYSLDREIENLGTLTNDWAAWDDTYAFVQNPSQEYISLNLVDDTLSELGLNFILYFDNNGNIIYSKAYDLEKDIEIPLENSIFSYIKDLTSTPPATDAADYFQGIFSDSGAPVIFAARPILTSLDEGPTQGILVFGKFLKGSLFEHLASSVDAEISILPYSSEKFFLYPPSPNNPEIRVNISQFDIVHFHSLIRDSANSPVFIFEQFLPRTIYQQGLKSGREFLYALIIGSLVVSITVMVALEYGFLRRISRLVRGVQNFDVSRQKKSDMIQKGRDEISSLSNEMYKAFTQLAETQNDLTTHLDFEKLLVGISTKFINLPIDKIDDGINRFLKVIGEFSKVDRSYILLLHEAEPNFMDNTHEWCAPGINSVKRDRQNISIVQSRWWFKKLQKGESIIINDVNLMPEDTSQEKKFFTNQSILSLAAIPMIVGGELIGLLGYDSVREKRTWSDQTILLLEVTGTVIANAIDRNRHEKRILQNQNNLSNLNELTKNSISKSTLGTACRLISAQLHTLINSDRAYLVIESENNHNLDIYYAGHRITLDKENWNIIQELMEKSDSKIIRSEDLDFKGNPSYVGLLGVSFMALPLFTESARQGMVVFSFDTPHVFSSDEITFCQQSASQITLSILKTKALQVAHIKSNELNALRATIADITSELELDKLLHTLLERAIRLMKADGGDFCMVDNETGDLKVVACINLGEEYVGTSIHYGEGASGKVLATKKTLLIEDYSSWPGRLETLKESGIRSTIMLPLVIGDRVLGTLGIFHFDPEKQFSKDNQHLLLLFAQHASIAMENALLFEKIQQMARIDEVTGLYNRRAFKAMADYEIYRAVRQKHSLSLAMIDLDNFKQVNDQFGHQVGDEVLREVANLCRETLRNIDIIGRYGGDEAVILMPETDEDNAVIGLERLRKAIEKTPITVKGKTLHITASIGIASYTQNLPVLSEIMDQADSSLYAAKKDGKNCVRIFKNPDE
ncbi:MAG: diguanylate cyclase [Anaerolineaceae bacterium]|nr:diguanylate cyclase [Anaerolineaceae bacterium]